LTFDFIIALFFPFSIVILKKFMNFIPHLILFYFRLTSYISILMSNKHLYNKISKKHAGHLKN